MPDLSIAFTDAEYGRLITASSGDPASFLRRLVLDSLHVTPEGEEEWRPFRSGEYDVSSFGRLRRAVPGVSTFVGRILKPTESATGYVHAALSVGSESRRFYMHRVVAEVFIGPCPAGYVVNHRDGDKRNNVLSNLEYLSQRDNAAHARASLPRHRGETKPRRPLKGRPAGDAHWSRRDPSKVARGERMGASKLTADVVTAIKARVAAGERQCAMAKEYGVSVAQVSRIVRGLRWAHVQ